MVGIYCIENIKNNKKYVGQSIHIEERLRKHFSKLKNNNHGNYHLQNSYNKYGKSNFKSYVLEECDKEELNDKEIYWIEKLNSMKKGFNLTSGGGGVKDWKAPDWFKEDVKNRVQGENNPNYGKHWTEEQKQKARENKIGKYVGDKNPNSKKIICVEKLKIYNTIEEAAKDCNIKFSSAITRCLKNHKYTSGGFHFVEYNNDIYEFLSKNKYEYLCECYKDTNTFFDTINKKFYNKKELTHVLKNATTYTCREIISLLKNKKIELNQTVYILL